VPAHLFGLEQVIEIGPMSGRSNVLFWLEKHGLAPSDDVVDRILAAAKRSSRILTEDEILALVNTSAAGKSQPR
jgi:2-isopropylmalate synthase